MAVNLEYDIVDAETCGELIHAVKLRIAEGWEPLGGVVVQTESENYVRWYFQAMVRWTEKEAEHE